MTDTTTLDGWRPELQQSLAALQAIFDESLARAEAAGLGTASGLDSARQTVILEVGECRLLARRRADPTALRPGATWSGPAQMTLVDSVGFITCMAHLPAGSDALTTDLAMQFLRPPAAGDLLAEVRPLRVGRRTAVLDVLIYSAARPEEPVSHATISFALRPAAPPI